MPEALDVAIAAGGTAGHINPALALADELSARGHHVTFYGEPDRLEATLVPQAGFDFVALDVSGFDRSRPWTLVSALVRMRSAEGELGRRFSGGPMPDVAIGFGAYVELPLLRWCHAKGVPTLIHEQNSVPGLANKTLGREVDRVCVAFPAAAAVFDQVKRPEAEVVVTGNPVRRSVIEGSRGRGREALGVSDDATVLLVFGGSLGARHLNQAVCSLSHELLSRPGVVVVHSTGKGEYDSVVADLDLNDDETSRYHVMPYIDDMGDMLAAADLVLSRAGASSVAEIAASTVPSVLVPYPAATADHQTTNAHLLVDAGAAELVPDKDLDSKAFSEQLLSLLDDPDRRARMRLDAHGLAQDKAASSLADQTEAVARARACHGPEVK
ncbi:MAG: UDP-N-acetylglucosamine--N-acetylmuramyl-(pentapeptide) pyrophosphoryl-undecaprenol N-acetylglucosamine transferase [Atopobiaceae bacterium]|jgi:UDP-N-acetylglucosamine--N-acetylmuramyl-(pentapeptide) pyrophosphoryl-undecaprenol N-acetylglucosamine transferase|nr:UDP-N-acetylglucosamine--N-acetylmuramyl-(pentapeptide) pyrophosphoryl-undecaprenol N-acetylglucosamine transferase [Atopobiaceae bacterium]MCH4180471.1 UDP-N-acetylglucosamine--N-acetylmuramyl-(pentapeptide) pyrophosphoryl-undecaprenol N-acetylglucosamine transferase [Atopobiaceae bacterium]MCH4214165.1 UDP-N-acetylglucosamine--N-acetylmuramyl-(pentapeptide) pyrophosphoryl-undecaprenol N-acetylglucosamine transferase [Atopobiaceae bacterium]MCH4229490.1 UDP-N-acetylglucosamine--N-acetylmuram